MRGNAQSDRRTPLYNRRQNLVTRMSTFSIPSQLE